MDALSLKLIEWLENLDTKLKYAVIFSLAIFLITSSLFSTLYDALTFQKALGYNGIFYVIYGLVYFTPTYFWDKATKAKINNTNTAIAVLVLTSIFALFFQLYAQEILDNTTDPRTLLFFIYAPALFIIPYVLFYIGLCKAFNLVFHSWFKKVVL